MQGQVTGSVFLSMDTRGERIIVGGIALQRLCKILKSASTALVMRAKFARSDADRIRPSQSCGPAIAEPQLSEMRRERLSHQNASPARVLRLMGASLSRRQLSPQRAFVRQLI